jgi:hypothetical protein
MNRVQVNRIQKSRKFSRKLLARYEQSGRHG